jgi:hypothetical protein
VPECACLFTSSKLIVFFFVDDIVVLFHHSDVHFYDQFKAKLMVQVKLREIGDLTWFLGIRVLRDRIRNKIWLCQDSYLEKMARKFNLLHKKAKTPLTIEKLIKSDGVAKDDVKHRY